METPTLETSPPSPGKSTTARRSTLETFIEAATDSIGRAIAGLQRESAREREVRDAEHRARSAELAVLLASVAATEQRLNERLAALKDGEPGKSVTADDLRPLVDAAVTDAISRLPPPERGRDADPEVTAALVRDEVARAAAAIPEAIAAAVAELPPPAPGKSVTPDDVRPMIEELIAALPPPAAGKDADPAATAALVAEQVKAAVAALPAPKDGAPGKLPIVTAWTERGVRYEGDVVTHAGGTWQAVRDTGREPPHEDWICLAAPGRDGEHGRSFTVRETWDAKNVYAALDVVALNGGAFVARRDDPGTCPGEGWQMIAMQGKAGKPGERSTVKGPPGPPVVDMRVDDQGLLTLANADGSIVECDLYPLLSKLG